MTQETVKDTHNLYSKSFVTQFLDRLCTIMMLRPWNRRSQQRVICSKSGRIWTYLRPQLHNINELEETVYETNVALDVMRQYCHHSNYA